MKKILQRLFDYKTLTRQEAKNILTDIAGGLYNETEVTAFITVYLMRSITIDELSGFRDALMQLTTPLNFNYDTIDIVGTGGDGKNTFNISTLSCFVVAGTGQKVTKHGNYAATSVSGASNVMELLGYSFKQNLAELNEELTHANICFLHAPLFHTTLKTVAPVRKQLGLRTFFNMLGPLVNPAKPTYQLIGVYNAEIGRVYKYMLQNESSNFSIVHGLDGYDEISLTSDTRVYSAKGETTFDAYTLGKRTVTPESIYGGSNVQQAADIFLKVLHGKGTWSQNAVVLANAAMALNTTGNFSTYEDAYYAAAESLESGAALNCFNKLIQLQK